MHWDTDKAYLLVEEATSGQHCIVSLTMHCPSMACENIPNTDGLTGRSERQRAAEAGA